MVKWITTLPSTKYSAKTRSSKAVCLKTQQSQNPTINLDSSNARTAFLTLNSGFLHLSSVAYLKLFRLVLQYLLLDTQDMLFFPNRLIMKIRLPLRAVLLPVSMLLDLSKVHSDPSKPFNG